ncbi:hypothetical protein [Shewanella livingstonensis]|uniref:Uncharacterized protein n=1 Tax=Shewanella livingstonensis TaxID=150120 RepID=A0A3G8LUX7_9GAMM|nr:hypothetical protein [Shewanella livingstonensis]AZG73399.1 hypothetical protein EGC82_11885 [Shewanella livingstonensis]
MDELSTESWMGIFFFITFCMWSIAVLLFGRITVKHIEREMAKEDILPAEWDKGIGMRYPAYASIIMRPNAKRHASLVNIEATKRFTREKDKKLAWLYIISSVSIFALGIFIYYLYIHKS